MAVISLTNTSIQYTGEVFQGNVTFDLNATDTEVKLDVGFKINLAAQLDFDSMGSYEYGTDEMLDWCKKEINVLNDYRLESMLKKYSDDFEPDNSTLYYEWIANRGSSSFNPLEELIKRMGQNDACQYVFTYVVGTCNEKANLSGLALIYPSGQKTSTHTIEFSLHKNSLFGYVMEELSNELQAEAMSLAGHKLYLWLSAELELSSGHTEDQFKYDVI